VRLRIVLLMTPLVAAAGCGGASSQGAALLKLHQLSSPSQDFTIAVPHGWDFTPASNGNAAAGTENPSYLSAPGDSEATVKSWVGRT
jgi:hypothetical protein